MKLAHREEGGSGKPLLLLHGAARTLEDWSLAVPMLVPHHRVVTVDLRGHGLSPEGAWTWDEVVGDVAELLHDLDLEDAVVAGHSLGGMVATLCAARLPVARAVNLDGLGAGVLRDLPEPLAAERSRELADLAVAQLPGCAAPVPLADWEQLLASVEQACQAGGIDPTPILAGLRRGSRVDDGLVRSRSSQEVVREVLAQVDRLDLEEATRAAVAPVLVVRCMRTTPLPPGSPDWLVEARREHEAQLDAWLPGVTMREVDASHGLLLEDPQLVAELLLSA
jgi:pimeloyl-ACP methyl ester carboxylesterase